MNQIYRNVCFYFIFSPLLNKLNLVLDFVNNITDLSVYYFALFVFKPFSSLSTQY